MKSESGSIPVPLNLETLLSGAFKVSAALATLNGVKLREPGVRNQSSDGDKAVAHYAVAIRLLSVNQHWRAKGHFHAANLEDPSVFSDDQITSLTASTFVAMDNKDLASSDSTAQRFRSSGDLVEASLSLLDAADAAVLAGDFSTARQRLQTAHYTLRQTQPPDVDPDEPLTVDGGTLLFGDTPVSLKLLSDTEKGLGQMARATRSLSSRGDFLPVGAEEAQHRDKVQFEGVQANPVMRALILG